MRKRGKLLSLLVAAAVAMLTLTQVPAAALADGRGDRHWDRGDRGHHRHWDRGHRGHHKHWDRGHHRGHHWKRHHHRHHYRHDRVIIVPPRYYSPPRHRHHHRHHYRAPSRGGLYLYFDLSSLLQAPVGAPVRWQDDDAVGTLVSTGERYDTAGRYCREYQRSVIVAGRQEQAWGTACLQPDGDWQIVSERN